MKQHKIGYVLRTPGEPIAQMLNFYVFDDLPSSRADIDKDVSEAFQNCNCRSVTVYEVRLVEVEKRKRAEQ